MARVLSILTHIQDHQDTGNKTRLTLTIFKTKGHPIKLLIPVRFLKTVTLVIHPILLLLILQILDTIQVFLIDLLMALHTATDRTATVLQISSSTQMGPHTIQQEFHRNTLTLTNIFEVNNIRLLLL